MSLTKTGTGPTEFEAGHSVSYEFTVENTGDATVEDLKIDDTGGFGGAGDDLVITCDATSLAPTDSTTCTASYALD